MSGNLASRWPWTSSVPTASATFASPLTAASAPGTFAAPFTATATLTTSGAAALVAPLTTSTVVTAAASRTAAFARLRPRPRLGDRAARPGDHADPIGARADAQEATRPFVDDGDHDLGAGQPQLVQAAPYGVLQRPTFEN
jgi:hypothetical protein